MSRSRNQIRFILDGQLIELDGPVPTRTLLQFLREDLGHCGTKEGCAEGDCGACTVVMGEVPPDESTAIAWRPINACIRFLPTLNGCEIVTAEGLSGPGQRLHPVQQALVDQHASQCGFCTPGFVMSLLGIYLNQPDAERASVVEALSGNLCRCTGYRPIIDAACAMNALPEPVQWSRADAGSAQRRARLASIRPDTPVHIEAHAPVHQGYHAPLEVDELAALCVAHPDALLLAGGTDVGLWVTKHLRRLPTVIYLGAVTALKQLREHEGMLEIGAAVSLSDACRAIVDRYPMLAELAWRFASPPVRNAGTLCGNIANGSPIGDSMPILIALGAQVLLRHGASSRVLPLQDLYLGYQKKDLQAGEFVASVSIPLPRPEHLVASFKISKRHDQDISAVCAAFVMERTDGLIREARVAYGGMAAIPCRAPAAEAALIGQAWSAATFDAAATALAKDYQPLSDMRASAAYRLQVAGNLLRRFYLENSLENSPEHSPERSPEHSQETDASASAAAPLRLPGLTPV